MKKATKAKKSGATKAPEEWGKRDPVQYMVNPLTGERDQAMGIEYDIHKINAEYKKLGCPEDVFDPSVLPYDKAKYFFLSSSRSVGKTTNVILWGMCANKIYGTTVMYVRQRESMIEKKYLDNTTGLMSTIRSYHYIEKLTGGRWNSCEYYARVWRYTNVDDSGKVVEKCPEAFMICLDVDQNEVYKSTLSAPLGDIVIFDELISKDYKENEAVYFLDLEKTIFRDRLSPICCFLLSNVTDVYNPYLREFQIQKHVAILAEGDSCIVQTNKGTRIYCEIIGSKNKVRPLVNTAWYGFDNPLLNSITGGGGWNIIPYPHIWRDENRETIQRHIYVLYQENVIELEICKDSHVGLHVCAHPVRKISDPAITVYTVGEIREPRHVYGFGTGRPIDKIVWSLYIQKKWYYADNDTGAIIEHYAGQAGK